MENNYYNNKDVKEMFKDISLILHNKEYSQNLKDIIEMQELIKIMLKLENKYNNFNTRYK